MTRRNQAHDKRNQKLDAVLTEYATTIAEIPALAEAVAAFRAHLGLVQPAVAQQLARKQAKGASLTKDNLEGLLIKQLVRFGSALYLLHKKESNLEVAASLPRHASEFQRLAGPELTREAQELAGLAQARANDLTNYAIKPADITGLATQVAAFAASQPGYKVSVERGKVGSQTLRASFKNINLFLEEDLRPAIELLATTHPDAYARLREALRLNEAGSRQKKPGAGGETGGLAAPQ